MKAEGRERKSDVVEGVPITFTTTELWVRHRYYLGS